MIDSWSAEHFYGDSWPADQFFTRTGDPRLWHRSPDFNGKGLSHSSKRWLVGSTEIDFDDITAAFHDPDLEWGEDLYLAAGKKRFQTEGGLVGDWEQQQGLR